MAGNFTFAIVKPDAFASGKTGRILALIEEKGFKILASRVVRLTQAEAESFYDVHKERPFFESLTSFMVSGPCMPLILEKDDAVAEFRKAIGATNPADAEEGTVRKLFAESLERNAIHGSDSDENAVREARFFFSESEVIRGR